MTKLCQSCSRFAAFPMALPLSRIPMMSYAEKPEDITKEEWMDKLNNVHIQRADMNRLIMNYLVTGEACSWTTVAVSRIYNIVRVQRHHSFITILNVFASACVSFACSKRDSKRLRRSFGWSLGSSQAWTWTLWMKE